MGVEIHNRQQHDGLNLTTITFSPFGAGGCFFSPLRLRLQENIPRAPLLPWRPKAASLGQPLQRATHVLGRRAVLRRSLQGPGLRSCAEPQHLRSWRQGRQAAACGLGGPRVLAYAGTSAAARGPPSLPLSSSKAATQRARAARYADQGQQVAAQWTDHCS